MARRTPASSSVPSLVAPSTTRGSTSMSPSPKTPLPDSPDASGPAEGAAVEVVDTPAETAEEPDPDAEKRAHQLKFLLDKSTLYAKIIGDRMEEQQVKKQKAKERAEIRRANKVKREAESSTSGRDGLRHGATETSAPAKRSAPASKSRRGKRVKVEQPEVKPVVDEEEEHDGGEGDCDADVPDDQKQFSFVQPPLVTGATLRDYQLAGVQWMISLYENGLNGILADEMGLGKTLQTISFLAHLRGKGTWGPFLIACPLSVLYNWVAEFEKFAPSIPVLMYHGTPEHRAELRGTRMKLPNKRNKGDTNTFPIIITTYEMVIRDRSYLCRYDWKFIVVDEGHRLKNLNCKLIQELKTYKSANRMILTGTPLHNNLAELWSLLNFILPDIFDDLESFQQWFNFNDMSSDDGLLNKSSIVHQLHGILKPFLLRRLKTEVERDLPPKKEYLLYAPLTQPQKDMYQAIVRRDIRNYLIAMKAGDAPPPADNEEDAKKEVAEDATSNGRASRRRKDVDYRIEENDSKWLRKLEQQAAKEPSPPPVKTAADLARDQYNQAVKNVNNMKLQNLVMQLRKVSSHPFLFDWPVDEESGDYIVNDDLVNASGKMLLLNRLLDALFARKHKVLIFSQFATMLDVIEDWARVYKKFKVCRIDGKTSQEDRRAQMDEFNNGGDSKDAPNLFLLSTRAGGLGINLVAADTVIFFDQDWNPQMDLQAQDRAHRIGQTKPVLIFRLVSEHTVESKILQKASNKRKLEALVIQQGKFGKVVDENGRVLLGRTRHNESTADMARALLDLEGEEINTASADDMIISDADLDVLLDRSPAAFAREKGWAAGLGHGGKNREEQLAKGERTAFEVFVPAKDEAADGLAHMFAGDGDQEEN